MAKVPFSKLDLKISDEKIEKYIVGKNGENITYEIYKYLPIEKKMNMISNIINASLNDSGFCNPLAVNLHLALEVVYNYTNFSFTEKQKENPLKLYDGIINNGLYDEIISSIPVREWEEIQSNLWDTIKNIYNYNNSAAGILEYIVDNYDSTSFDVNQIMEKLTNDQDLSTLKNLLPFVENTI